MEKLLEIINKVRDNKGLNSLNEIQLDFDIRQDLKFDSLDLAELTVRCEKEFGVDIFENGLVTTIKEIMEKLDV